MSRIHGCKVIYENFSKFLRDLAKYCHVFKTVLVMYELPFLLDAAPYVAGYLQSFIDLRMNGEETMLIVCGFSVSFMVRRPTTPQGPFTTGSVSA